MKIYSYVITSDDGFAPNPFWGYCTLTTCKPVVRRKAACGDWVVGTGSVENVGNDHLIYAMKVTEKMTFEEYWNDKRFVRKKPGKESKRSVGDNIYYRDKTGVIKQYYPSEHSLPNGEDLESRKHDLGGEYVLISERGEFYYFGDEARKIPKNLLCLIKKGPAHKCNFPDEVIHEFLSWIRRKKPGMHGDPCDYANTKLSCRTRELHNDRSRRRSKTC